MIWDTFMSHINTKIMIQC